MFSQLTSGQTAYLLFLTLLAVTVIIIKVIDALNKRGERAHARFLEVRGAAIDTDVATPTPERRPVKIDGLGEIGIKAHRPIKDNPQA
jgi:hypothetical protein